MKWIFAVGGIFFPPCNIPKNRLGAAFDIRMAQLTLKQYEELALLTWKLGDANLVSRYPPGQILWAGLSENLEVRGMQRKIEMICLFREESEGGSNVFESVSEDSNIWFHFFRTKVSMFFSTHTVSKKQKSMAFLRMPCFWGMFFLI